MNFVKKKLSGAENKKRKIEKQTAALKNSQNISQFLLKGGCFSRSDLSVCEIESNY